MSQEKRPIDGSCCSPPIQGLRRLTFADGTQVGISGLDAVMEKLYRGGRPADEGIGAEMMAELRSENYFEPSARQAYEELFRKEYDRFLRARSESREKKENSATAGNAESQKARKKGLFRRFKPGNESAKE